MKRCLAYVMVLVCYAAMQSFLMAEGENAPPSLQFTQHIGRELPLDLRFRDQEGRSVALREYFSTARRPVILVPGYVRCEMLCSALSDGFLRAVQGLPRSAGRDFQVVYVSIDPEETDGAAARKKRTWLQRYGRLGCEDGVVYLRGDRDSVATLMQQIGFEYQYDAERHEYAHPAGFVIVSGAGVVTHYFLGVVFSAREVEAAIEESSHGERGSIVERFLLICSHYNPIRSKYGGVVMACVRVMACGVMVGLVLAVRSRRVLK